MITPENIGKITDGLIGLGLVLIGVIVFNLLFYTPTRIFKCLQPKLKVNFKPGIRPWVNAHDPTSNGQNIIFRIELMNLGLEKIYKARVRLMEIDPHPHGSFNTPCDLQVNNNEIPKTYKEGKGEFVDFFKYFRHSKGGVDHPWIIGCSSVENKDLVLTVKKYEFEIEVSSVNGGDSIVKYFQFDPTKKDAKYCMEMIA